jgi:hypothetical protein
MKKSRREFFEVFRRVPEEKEPTTWWRKNPAATPADEPATANAAAAKPLSRRETPAPSNKVVLALSRELLVVLAVALVLALVGAFVWGYSLRRSDSTTVATNSIQPPDATRAQTLAMTTPNQPALPYYTLRMQMSSIDHHRAEQIAADLCAMGYDAFPLQVSASSWSVNIGRFASYQTKEAAAFKKKVSPVTYRNQRWLCSWEPVRK